MDPVSASAAASLSKTGLDLAKALVNLARPLTSKLKSSFDESRARDRIRTLYANSFKYYRTRSIINPEKDIDFREYYVPPSFEYRRTILNIDSTNDITNYNSIFLGLPGHGKSTFLKHLALKDIDLGEKIPAFCELRKLKPQEELLDFILENLKNYGFEIELVLLEKFAEEGLLNFYFDGFDELQDTERKLFIREVETISSRFPKCKFIISCRHGHQIEQLVGFEIYRLKPLSFDQVELLIRKVYPNGASSLVAEIQTPSKAYIRDLIKTPIMVMLLAINHMASKNTPEQIVDYYNDLFTYLLRRHDENKIDFHRKRLSELDDNQFKKLFSAFCYYIQTNPQDLSVSRIHDFTNSVISKTKVQTAAEKFISDLQKITGILFLEGHEYHFIHKSVSEFFAAFFISRLESGKQKFYEHILKNEKGNLPITWAQTLKFLQDLDKLSWANYLRLPQIRQIAGENPLSKDACRTHIISSIVADGALGIDTKSSFLRVFSFSSNFSLLGPEDTLPQLYINGLNTLWTTHHEQLLKRISSQPFTTINDASVGEYCRMPVKFILDEIPGGVSYFNEFLANAINRITNEYSELTNFVKESEEFDPISSI